MTAEAALPTHVPLTGTFRIYDTCIDCHLCEDLAPANFDCDPDSDTHYVYKQPDTDDELESVLDACESCPSDSIKYLALSTEE